MPRLKDILPLDRSHTHPPDRAHSRCRTQPGPGPARPRVRRSPRRSLASPMSFMASLSSVTSILAPHTSHTVRRNRCGGAGLPPEAVPEGGARLHGRLWEARRSTVHPHPTTTWEDLPFSFEPLSLHGESDESSRVSPTRARLSQASPPSILVGIKEFVGFLHLLFSP